MLGKSFAVIAIAVIAIFSAPAAANASGYVPSSGTTVSGSSAPGGTAIVSFASGDFNNGENVSFSVTGNTSVTLSAIRAAVMTSTLTKTASSTGSVVLNVGLPTTATGTYSVTATGVTSGNVGTATITVTPASTSTGGIPPEGLVISPLIVWGGSGAILLGLAFLLVSIIARRRRHALALTHRSA